MDKRVQTEPGNQPRVLYEFPAFLIRVARQKSMASFEPITVRYKITPQQYSILRVTAKHPDIDQNELGERISLDAATLSEMVGRMQQRGLLLRRVDGRSRRLTLTPEAVVLLEAVQPEVEEAQRRLMAPLTAREQQRFLQLISKLVGIGNRFNAPRRRGAVGNSR